jgi:predicted transcriptional regulator
VLALSRLERYIAIIKVLAFQGPLEQAQLQRKTKLSSAELQEYHVMLVHQKFVHIRVDGDSKRQYSITAKGNRVLSYLKILNEKAIVTEKYRQ